VFVIRPCAGHTHRGTRARLLSFVLSIVVIMRAILFTCSRGSSVQNLQLNFAPIVGIRKRGVIPVFQ